MASPLSPHQAAALRAIVIRPGRLTDAYNGRTIRALTTRGLVRLDNVDVAGVKRDAVYPTLAGYELSGTHGGWNDAV
jgi:hypothetical protein